MNSSSSQLADRCIYFHGIVAINEPRNCDLLQTEILPLFLLKMQQDATKIQRQSAVSHPLNHLHTICCVTVAAGVRPTGRDSRPLVTEKSAHGPTAPISSIFAIRQPPRPSSTLQQSTCLFLHLLPLQVIGPPVVSTFGFPSADQQPFAGCYSQPIFIFRPNKAPSRRASLRAKMAAAALSEAQVGLVK